MASNTPIPNKEHGDGIIESGSDDKPQIDLVDGKSVPSRMFEPPEFLRHMTTEERNQIESKLKRKIDMRLMPMIILMYEYPTCLGRDSRSLSLCMR